MRNGGQVQLAASTLTNVSIDSSTTTGVVLSTLSGSNQIFSSSSVSIPYNSQWVIEDGSSLWLRNPFGGGFSLNNSGTVVLNGSSPTGATLRISGWGTFTGSGTVDLGTNGYGYITGAGTERRVVQLQHDPRRGTAWTGLASIYNGGTIRPASGSLLTLSGIISNSPGTGMIWVDTNSVVRFQNATVIGGDLVVRNGGQVQLAASTLTNVSLDPYMTTGVVLRTVSGSNQIFSSSLTIPYNSQWVIGDGSSLRLGDPFGWASS